MKSVMEHSFSRVPAVDIPRSTFNRSHGVKTTWDADYLVPVLVDHVVPGDSFRVNMSFFARLATPLYPLMDNLYLESFFFYVPNRLVWDNWEKFLGAQVDPADSIDYTIPTVSKADNAQTGTGKLWDYMGLPINLVPNDVPVSALPFRCYQIIYNEWFRDQNLQDSVNLQTGDGPDAQTSALYGSPLKRGKRHDYFTSCLPWPQKGDAVDLPLGTEARVLGIGVDVTGTTFADPTENINQTGPVTTGGTIKWLKSDISGNEIYIQEDSANPGFPYIRTDLTAATAATINDLRLAFQTQRLLERDARSGTRINETIKAHFGVTVPDYRVQRPEFLGGGSSAVNMTPVPNTTTVGQQGDLAAYGTVAGTHSFTKSFTEHGIILGLINVRGDITYSQGVERHWSKSTRYDFYYPVLSQIGEQSVLNKEIWADGTANDDLVFGYQERYAEMRYKPSTITGLFRPDASGTLAAWHLSEDFATLPTLGDTFIQSNTGVPLDRAIAVPTEPHFIGDFYFDMKCARPMPLFGVPGNLDHF